MRFTLNYVPVIPGSSGLLAACSRGRIIIYDIKYTEARINERTLARMRMAAGSRSGDLFLSTGSRRGGLSFAVLRSLQPRRPREYLLIERAIGA